jgi:rubrerythrin
MGLELDGSDVLAMAKWIERQAEAFYAHLADKVHDQITRKILGDLAAMERDHEHIFHSLRDEHIAAVSAEVLPYAHILMQLCVDVRSTLKESFTGRESPTDMLGKAIEFEKSTVVFFAGLRETMPDDASRAQVDAILREEVGHIFLLSGQLPHVGKSSFGGNDFRGLGDPASV